MQPSNLATASQKGNSSGSIQICQQNVTIFYVGLIQSKRHYLTYNLRSNRNVCLHHCRTKIYGLDSLSYHVAHLWNLLPNDMKKCKDLDIFKASVRNWNEPTLYV